MNHKNLEILKGIAEVCKKRNVFVIDDLVYRDLTYDIDDLAVPIASMPEYFNNTISLFGLSKAYGVASFRAAVVVAPVAIADVLTQKIHDSMDSMPVLQVAAVAGALNGSNRRYREFRRYTRQLTCEYQYRYHLIYSLVYGVNKITDKKLRDRIKRTIRRYAKEDYKMLVRGCPNLAIRKGMEPESGFFTVFDFTKLSGKKTPDGKEIKTEQDLLEYFFVNGGVMYLMGGNICWPVAHEMVGRVSFGVSRKAIVNNMRLIGKAIRRLK
jgi:aspartate aminotransferase